MITNEIIDLLEELDNALDVFIEPTYVHELTDEGSGLEDVKKTKFYHFHNLSKRQLLAPSIILAQNGEYEDTSTNSCAKRKHFYLVVTSKRYLYF